MPTLTLAVVTTFHTALAKSADAPTKAWWVGDMCVGDGGVKVRLNQRETFFQGQKATPPKNGSKYITLYYLKAS